MATTAADATEVCVQLSEDIYLEQSEFTDLARDVTNSIDGDTTEEADLLEPHGLVQVVYAKMESQLDWAKTAGAALYRVLLETIDPTLEFEVFGDCSLLGASIAVQYTLDAAEEFIACETRDTRSSVAILEVASHLVAEEQSGATLFLACGSLERMAQSYYLFFNDNYGVFAPFAYRVVPHMDAVDKTGKSSQANTVLTAPKDEDYERTNLQVFQIKRLFDHLGKSDLYERSAEPTTMSSHTAHAQPSQDTVPIEVETVEDRARYAPIPVQDLEKLATPLLALFAILADWNCPKIDRLIDSVTSAMKIGAWLAVQTTTYETIEAMVQSEYLFFHKNLKMLLHFIFAVGPTLDGMAKPHRSARLTALLGFLRDNTGEHTEKESRDIDDLRRALGRKAEDVRAPSMSESDVEDELAKAAAKLGMND